MQWQVVLAGCAIVAVAAALRRLTGMGFAMISVSFLSLMIAPADAVLVTLFLQLFLGVRSAGLMLRATYWRLLPALGLAAAIATPVGLLFIRETNEAVLRVTIGICVLLALVPLLLGRRVMEFRATHFSSAVCGLLAGFLNCVAAAPAPPLLMYLMGVREIGLEQRRATLISIFTLLTTISVVGRVMSGDINMHAARLALFLCPATLVGDYIGRRMPGAFNARLVDRVSIAIIAISASILIFSSLSQG